MNSIYYFLLFVILILLTLYLQVRNKYKGIKDVNSEILKLKSEIFDLEKKSNILNEELDARKAQLNKEYQEKRAVFEALSEEVSVLEVNLDNISYGVYKPHFSYGTSEEYKQKLLEISNKQAAMLKDNKAAISHKDWLVDGNREKGLKMIRESSKLMLRAFNGDCDSAIAKVSWNNVSNMEARIKKSFDTINKLGATNMINISDQYMQLKLDELHVQYESEKKIREEKEEQRIIKERMRDEEKAIKELERATREAQQEEDRYEKALQKAKLDLEIARGDELERLNEKIKILSENLDKAHQQKERAISQAQLTKSGHVYIISNIGSFGENVFKIGMTRRLEPVDRVKELGDASVPFDFDIHGLIYSEDAPGLENKLHKMFDHKRINLVNTRAEFFFATIDEIESAIRGYGISLTLTKLAEAREYRESIAIRDRVINDYSRNKEIEEGYVNKITFPNSL